MFALCDILYVRIRTNICGSGFGIVGGLAIGKASASFAVEVNEDPTRKPSSLSFGSMPY